MPGPPSTRARLRKQPNLCRVARAREEDQLVGAEGLASLVAKYAPYRESRPPGPLLALEPERCLFWRASDARPGD